MKKLICTILSLAIVFSSLVFAAVPASAATANEVENNDDFEVANEIVLGNSISGTIYTDDKANHVEEDYFKVTVPDNGKLALTFQHKHEKVSAPYWNVSVYKDTDNGPTMIAESIIYLNGSEKFDIPVLGVTKNTTYYIKVWIGSGDGVVGKQYTIKTAFTSTNYYEKEQNDDYTTANKISLNKIYSGTINHSGTDSASEKLSNMDHDVYRVTATANGRLDVKFAHKYAKDEDITVEWGIELYRYYKGEYILVSHKFVNISDKELISLPYTGAVKNGTYYIVVKGYNDDIVGHNYSIKAALTKSEYYEKEKNDEYSTATTIKPNYSYSGIINYSYDDGNDATSNVDVDNYKIVAPATGYITFRFAHNYVKDSYDEFRVTVYKYSKKKYTEVGSDNIALKEQGTADICRVKVSKGQVYYIAVEACSDNVIGQAYKVQGNFAFTTVSKLKANPTKTTAKLSWAKDGTKSYEIQRKSGSKYKAVAKTSKTSYTNKKLSRKTTYTYRIRTYKKVDGVTYYGYWKYITVKTK